MQLIENWQTVLKKAWSVKFNIAAALFGGAELAVAFVKPDGVPNGVFAGISFVVSVCAFAARFLAQKEITNAAPK